MIRVLALAAGAALLAGCGSESKPSTPQKTEVTQPARPADETRRFPVSDQVSTQLVNDHILNEPFMPGGTIAHYQKGKAEYDMFVAQFPTSTDAAIALANLEGSLKDPKLIPTFGGYFGTYAGRPAFVFPKDRWLAGVIGLPQTEADTAARVLAAHLN